MAGIFKPLKSETMNLIKSWVSFDVNEQHVEFEIIHNLPNVPGVCFDDALENWLARTAEYTAESLCRYILSKEPYRTAQPYKSETK